MVTHEIIVALLPAEVALCTASWIMMLEYSCSRTSSEMNIDLDEGAHGVEVDLTAYTGVGCFTFQLSTDLITSPFLCVILFVSDA